MRRLLADSSKLIAADSARTDIISWSAACKPASKNVPLRAALAAYFYQSLAAICAAALKLIRIGQDGCQRVLRTRRDSLKQTIRRVAARCSRRRRLVQSAPGNREHAARARGGAAFYFE